MPAIGILDTFKEAVKQGVRVKATAFSKTLKKDIEYDITIFSIQRNEEDGDDLVFISEYTSTLTTKPPKAKHVKDFKNAELTSFPAEESRYRANGNTNVTVILDSYNFRKTSL